MAQHARVIRLLPVSGNSWQAEGPKAEITVTELYTHLQLSIEAVMFSIGIYLRSAKRNSHTSSSNASDFSSYFKQDRTALKNVSKTHDIRRFVCGHADKSKLRGAFLESESA